jgi:hypothetical protein
MTTTRLPACLLRAVPCALLCALQLAMPARGADPARYRLTIPAGVAGHEPGGTIRFIGTATVLVRVRGLAVLIDPDDSVAPADLAAADLVLLSQPGPEKGAEPGSEPISEPVSKPVAQPSAAAPSWRSHPVVSMASMAARLRDRGLARVYPLDTWEAVAVRKGAARLRLTSMADLRGTRPAVMAAMLDFGPACRLLVHQAALAPAEIALLPQRFPGMRQAVLRQDGTPLLLSMAGQGAQQQPVAHGQPYRFGSADCR